MTAMIRYSRITTIAGHFALLLLGFSATTFASGDHAHNDMTKTIQEYRELTETEQMVQGVMDTYARAMAEGSIEIMEQAIIPGDFSTIESGYPNWTWESFRDTHLAEEFKVFSEATYDIDLIVGETQGSLGFAVFRYTAAGKVQGNTVSISGLGTAILEATDAGWRIHHLHTSAPRDQLEQAAAGATSDHGDTEDAHDHNHGDNHAH
jgi:hypothetical protein